MIHATANYPNAPWGHGQTSSCRNCTLMSDQKIRPKDTGQSVNHYDGIVRRALMGDLSSRATVPRLLDVAKLTVGVMPRLVLPFTRPIFSLPKPADQGVRLLDRVSMRLLCQRWPEHTSRTALKLVDSTAELALSSPLAIMRGTNDGGWRAARMCDTIEVAADAGGGWSRARKQPMQAAPLGNGR